MELIITEIENKQTICLNMIVKNEADIIVDTFNNILAYIKIDYWVISDTGSTDNTKEVIVHFFKEKGIDGELLEDPWSDFGYNRSKALESAFNKTDYLLIFDADDRFYGNFKLPDTLSHDSYHLKIGKGFEYTRPLLINNRKQWCFKGVLHEYLSPLNDNSNRTMDNIVGDYYVDSGKFGNRSKNPNKALDDAIVLKEAYEKELTNPTGLANRYAFYCAQSYKDCNENILSIEWYKKVLTLDNWAQEKYYACLMVGDLYNRLKDEEKSVFYWLKTVVYDSERIEGIVNAMDYYRKTGQHLLVNALYHQFKNYNKNISGYNKLFIDTTKYLDVIEYNNSISAFYTNDKKSGYECCKKIIINNKISSDLLINTIDNILFYQDLLEQDLLDQENEGDIEKLFNKIDFILDNKNIKKADKTSKKIWNILHDKIESNKEMINLNNISNSRNISDRSDRSDSRNISDISNISDSSDRSDSSDSSDISNSNLDTIVKEINCLHSKKQEFGKAYEIYVKSTSLIDTKNKDFYKLEYEYSLFAFYIGIKNIDKQIITILNNCEDYTIIKNVLSNMKFYKNILTPEKTINLDLSMNHVFNGVSYFFNSSSSCIIPNKTKDGYLLNARLVNYRITEDGNYVDWGGKHIVTMNKYIELTKNFEIAHEQLLEPIYEDVLHIGTEDIRIFNHKDVIYYLGTIYYNNNNNKNIGIVHGVYDIKNKIELDGTQLTPLFNTNSECEKNWIYFNYHNELSIVYNWFPLKICKINKDDNTILELIEEKPMPNLFKYARGSTCGAAYNNEIWFVIHIVSYESPRHYYHVIVVFDKNMNLLRYSAPFKFEDICIEYCLGLIVEDSRVIMSYSTMDRTTKISTYNKSYIDSILIYEFITQQNNNNTPIKIINLKRRQDRKDNVINLFEISNISNYEFIEAVDGKTLIPTLELKNLFNDNNFNNRRGVIGCALSHYNLWKKLINDTTNDFYLILEDDISMCENFSKKLETINQELKNKDIIFLGYHMYSNERNNVKDIYNVQSEEINIKKYNNNLYIGGTFSYSINKSGAQKMIDYINKNGIKHGIDYVIKYNKDIDIYESQPHLIFSEWNEGLGKEFDTDIQNNFDSIDFTSLYKKNIEELKNEFIFIKQMDQVNEDIYFKKLSIEEMLLHALNDEKCVAFNTLGFFKSKVTNLQPSPYFKIEDGIYIKKEFYKNYMNNFIIETNLEKSKIKRVKMLCNWCSSKQLCLEWSNMCSEPTDFRWNDIEITWDNTNIDYYVIINYPQDNEYYNPLKTIVFQMEPWVYDKNRNWGVKVWGEWANPDKTKFLSVRGRKTDTHNNAVWHIELNLNQLLTMKFEKTKENKISTICSSKYQDEGHILRIEFLKFLENKINNHNDDNVCIDIYSRNNHHNFKNYKTPLTDSNKSLGIAPYKYYFMMENNFEKDFITEKIWEPILCETLCFYYGCPNISEYLDPLSYVLLDANDFEKSYSIIKTAIKEDWWSQRIDIIRKEKDKILNQMSFFPIVDKIIKNDISKINIF